MAVKAVNISQLDFKNWGNVTEGKANYSEPLKRHSSFFGKVYFYYDQKQDRLFIKNFNLIERVLHRLFGYESRFNRTTLWQFFKARQWVKLDAACPSKKAFRKIAGENLSQFSELKRNFFSFNATETQSLDLFAKGLDVNSYENEHMKPYKPLNVAIYRKFGQLTRYLVDHGATVNPTFDYTKAFEGRIFNSPLAEALQLQQWDTALLLLEKNADVNALGYLRSTPLHYALGNPYASSFIPNLEVIEELLKRGARVNAVNDGGHTPLNFAVGQVNIAVIELLLKWGAKPSHKDLEEAIRKYNPQLVKLLLDRGARSPEAFTIALGGIYPKPLGWKPNEKILQYLIECTYDSKKAPTPYADLNTFNSQGETALHLAVERDFVEAATTLNLYGNGSDIKNKAGKTAKELAKSPEMVALFTRPPLPAVHA